MKGWYLKIILGKGIWFFTTRGQESTPPASNLDGSRSLFLDEKTSVWTQELIWTNNRNRACSVQINDNVIGVHHLLLILELRNGSHDPPKDKIPIFHSSLWWSSTCPLTVFFWLLSHVIYLKLSFWVMGSRTSFSVS